MNTLLAILWHSGHSSSLLQQWADENG